MSSSSSPPSPLPPPTSPPSSSSSTVSLSPSPSHGPRYRILRVIGRGSFGVVSLCEDLQESSSRSHSRHTSTSSTDSLPSSPSTSRPSSPTTTLSPRQLHPHYYVMKQIAFQSSSTKESLTALQEVRLLKALSHPFIVKYRDSWIDHDTSSLWIVMHYCAGGDLATRLAQHRSTHTPISEPQVLDWFIQLCLALRYCHDRKLLHRDIKTHNVFLTHSNIARLGDFGIARVLTSTREMAKSVVGTPYSLAPEVCESREYGYGADVWALGCVLYEMMGLRRAFEAENLLGLVWKIVHGKVERVEGYSDELWGLVERMLSKKPEDRPTVKEVLMSPFIQQRVSVIVEQMKQRKVDKKHKKKETRTGEVQPVDTHT